MILVVNIRVNGRKHSYRCEKLPWIKICILQTVALLYLKCVISQTMESQRSIRKELQYKAKQNLIST